MMQFLSGLLLTSFLRISVQTKTNQQIERTHVFKGSIQHLSSRMDISKQSRMSDDYVHEVIFVIKQKNMEELTRFLHDVSDPQSANYGQHMTGTAVSDLTYNSQGRESLLEYLHSTGATVVTETLGGEYITASAPIPVWERMFSCEFFMFHQTQKNEIAKRVVRTESYSIPVCLDNHVEGVFGTVELPRENLSTLRSAMIDPDNEKFDLQATDYTNPTKLRAAYNMGSSTGSDSSTQAIYASLNQYFSSSDLSQFQTSSGINQQAVSTSIGGHESSSACINATNCVGGNLNTQYIIAASPISPTTFLYTDMSTFSDWLVLVANTQKPALVLLISYGIDEAQVSYAERDAFNTQAIKLGVMGVTIVVSSGDNGAVSRQPGARGLDRCKYSPTFPAASPYVTAVGATLGVESGTTEVACAVDKSIITSGGGFSTLHSQPSFQTKAVSQYFVNAAAAGQTPFMGYNRTGRGYPDVSLAGSQYTVVIGGKLYSVSGTGLSGTVVAGLFSNINAARIAVGKGSIGWVNPALYKNSNLFVNDITSGNNKCTSSSVAGAPNGFVCCDQGFFTAPGWDPVTGLGSLNYGKMESAFLALGDINTITNAPTKSPTTAPPTAYPTILSKPTTTSPLQSTLQTGDSNRNFHGMNIVTVAAIILTSAGLAAL